MAREVEGQSKADRAETKQWEQGKQTEERQDKESKKDTNDWEKGKQGTEKNG